ncbi:MAG: hypothetical protein V7459_06580 [Oceanicoccus sp.]
MPLANNDKGTVDEMSIVDVFTKLIFDAEAVLNDTEVQIVDCLGLIESSLTHSPRREIGEFLRSMGVDEMISLVATVKCKMDQQQLIAAKNLGHDPRIHH